MGRSPSFQHMISAISIPRIIFNLQFITKNKLASLFPQYTEDIWRLIFFVKRSKSGHETLRCCSVIDNFGATCTKINQISPSPPWSPRGARYTNSIADILAYSTSYKSSRSSVPVIASRASFSGDGNLCAQNFTWVV